MRAIIKCKVVLASASPAGNKAAAVAAAEESAVENAAAEGRVQTLDTPHIPATSVVRIAEPDRIPYEPILRSVMKACDWWPNLPQSHPEILRVMAEIFENVADADKPIISDTIMFTIRDPETNTYGIVNQTGSHFIEFRLKNGVSDRLKKACTDLVVELSEYVEQNPDAGIKKLDFYSRIEILEPKSQHQALIGVIGERGPWARSISDRKPSFYLALISTISFIACLYLTSPWGIFPASHDANGGNWLQWAGVLCSHATPAMLVAAIIAWLEVILHWRHLSRAFPIEWRANISSS